MIKSGRYRLLWLWCFCALMALATPLRAADRVLQLDPHASLPIPLSKYFEVLEDPQQNLSFAQVRQAPHAARFQAAVPAGDALNLGFTDSVWWFRLTLNNGTEQAAPWLLEIAYCLLGDIQLYQPMPNGKWQMQHTGLLQPFASRAYPNRLFVFPVTVPAHTSQVVYLRVKSRSVLLLPGYMWTPNAFRDYERNGYLAQAWYFGMVSSMILFNLLLFVVLRDRIYLTYVLFALAAALTAAERVGLAKEFLWPDAPYWSQIALGVGFALTLLALLTFMRQMLDTQKILARLDRWLRILSGVLLLIALGMALVMEHILQIAALIFMFTLLVIFATGLYCAWRRQRSAILFVLAFLTLMLGAMFNVLKVWGLAPVNSFTSNGMQFGSALEMILLAFALADRFNTIRRERAQAHILALRAQGETELATNQLLQSEKMAGLGQLIASVNHEINTPIGAVKASGQNIADALGVALGQLPRVMRMLNDADSERFLGLINCANQTAPVLSSREERALIREGTRQLEAAGIADAQNAATILVQLNAQSMLATAIPLLRHPQAALILNTANSLASVIQNTHNINRAVGRVTRIITALKSFSRVNHEALATEASLQEGIETVLTIYQGKIRHGVDLVRQFQEIGLLRCFPDELNQVWTNLIHNALQAMQFKGTLTIGIARIGNEAVVSIGDTGAGIEEAIRSKVFDSFFTTKPSGEGSGLGLNIVRRIVKKHGGRIDFQSEVGVGTTFFVYLPYDGVALAAAAGA
jgi:signal transduction histidine kinase